MGHAISLRLGKDHRLLLADVNHERLDAEVADLARLGICANGMVVDVRDRAQVEELAARAKEMGVVDTVIHTAGLSPAGASAESIIGVNALGTVNMTEAFLPVMAEGGVMINFGSSAAFSMDPPQEWLDAYACWNKPVFFDMLLDIVGEKEEDGDEDDEFFRAGQAYALTKRFVVEFSRANTCRFADCGVRILSFSPGSYLTPMHQLLIDNQPDMAETQLELTPLGRWGRPVEVAGFIEFLCSPLAAYVTGVDILADGGTIALQRVPQISQE